MIIWIFLSLIVIAASFILAFRSMRNFKEFPAKTKLDFATFLIKKEEALTPEFLTDFFDKSKSEYPDMIISLERLFKGNQKALVIYAPSSLLSPFAQTLGLIELEDYSAKEYGQYLVWEMGSKSQFLPQSPVWSQNSVLASLSSAEQVWWQTIIKSDSDHRFKINVRVAVWGETNKRVQDLQNSLSKVDGLLLLPNPETSEEKIRLYRQRAFTPGSLASDALPLKVDALAIKKLTEAN